VPETAFLLKHTTLTTVSVNAKENKRSAPMESSGHKDNVVAFVHMSNNIVPNDLLGTKTYADVYVKEKRDVENIPHLIQLLANVYS